MLPIFSKFNKQSFPDKIFNDKNKAINWLIEHMQ